MKVASQPELIATENADETPKESSSKSSLKSKPSKTSVKYQSASKASLKSETADVSPKVGD